MILLFLINYEAYLHANAKDVVASLSFFAERRGQPLSHIPEREHSALQWEVEEQGDWHQLRRAHRAGQKRRQLDRRSLCGIRLWPLCSESLYQVVWKKFSGSSSQRPGEVPHGFHC